MATIKKRGANYLITLSLGYDDYGKQKRMYETYVPDPAQGKREQERAVKLYALELENKIKRGKYYSGENMSLETFAEKWMSEYAEEELEKSTVYGYQFVLKRILPELGKYKLKDLSALILKEYFNSLKKDGVRLDGKPGGYGDKTITKTKQVLSVIMSTAVEWGIMESNPCAAVRLRGNKKVGTKQVKHFTYEQAKTFLEALDKPLVMKTAAHNRIDDTGKPYHVPEYFEERKLGIRFRFLFNLALFSGCRREELLALTWEDFNFDESSISINKAAYRIKGESGIKATKTESSTRIIFLPEKVMVMAKEHKQDQREKREMLQDRWAGETGMSFDKNFIFTQWNGKMMGLTTPNKKLSKVIGYINHSIENEKNKLPAITLHGLRHTSATLLIAENLDIVAVAGRLGHSDAGTTINIYAHALRERDQKASKILGDIFDK